MGLCASQVLVAVNVASYNDCLYKASSRHSVA